MVSRLGTTDAAATATAVKAGVDPCKRCLRKSVVQSVTVSRGEAFCGPCFDKFLATKVRKQLGDESYKPLYLKDKTPVETTAHVLVPVLTCMARDGLNRVSAGMATLDMMCEVIRGHRKAHRGRQGMYLHVLEVAEEKEANSGVEEWLRQRYTENEISEYKSVTLESFYESASLDSELWESVQIDQSLIANEDKKLGQPKSLSELLAILPSKTSRADVLSIIVEQLIRTHAKLSGCQTVFQPHTLTFLAERAMAAVCKGRGIELGTSLEPQSQSPADLLEITPLADLYDTEIQSYLTLHNLALPPYFASLPQVSASTAAKAMSMDQLLHKYFADIDAAFPSVTTTVVRTVDKLARPFDLPGTKDSGTYAGASVCRVCGTRRQQDALSWLYKISVMQLDTNTDINHDREASTGSSTPQKALENGPKDLCYACVVMFRNSATESILWPRNRAEDVVSEYGL